MAVVWTATANPAITGSVSSPYSFTGVSIGTASSDRIVVVALFNNDGGPTTSLTIGGVTATAAVLQSPGSSENGLWYANVPTGTTATVIVTNGGTFVNLGIMVGTITGAGASGTPNSTASEAFGFNGDPQTTSTPLTIQTGGIGIVNFWTETPNASPTWNVGTQDLLTDLSTSYQTLLGHITTTGSVTPSISGYNFQANIMLAMSFGPAAAGGASFALSGQSLIFM